MLKGKAALVTGSSSGIGLAVAHSLASKHADIALHGLLDPAEGKELATEFRSEYGVNCIFDGADLTDVSAIKRLIGRVVSELGGVDILINNAGIQYIEEIGKFPESKWNDIIAINLSAAFHAMQEVIPLMRENKWGRIVNIASVHGLVGSVNKSAYCASKHGLIGLTKVAALENAALGITANSICPGWVDTPMVNVQVEQLAQQSAIGIDAAREKLLSEKQPIIEMLKPSCIGDLVVFLCSDSATVLSGAALPIDGAWTAQ